MQEDVTLCKLVHKNYEKITDELMWLSKNWVLKFTVILNKYSDKFGRMNYHKEVGYYKNGDYCININRAYEYYLIIESIEKDNNGNKEAISIGLKDMFIFKHKLQMVSDWFMSSEYKGLFAKKDGRIFMPQRIEPIKITNLPFNKYIEFEPSILNLDNDDQVVGVRVYMNTDFSSLFMSIDKFIAFKYFIDNFNMHEAALLMINYLQRPEYGSNLFDMNNGQVKHKFL